VFIFIFFNNNQFFIMKKSVYLLLAGALFFTACKKTEEEPPKSLYVRLGGNAAISGVIDQFVANVAADTRINAFFADAAADPVRLKKLRDNLINQVGAATGGPEIYSGMTMKAAHKGMNVQEADFNALVDDLSKALDKFSVPATEKSELLGALATMKADIVEPSASLYAQLGGNAAISAVIDQFITNVAGDARINAFFADAAADPARLTKLRNNLINQVGMATGGTEKYTGLSMKAAHKGMNVQEADFNALVDDLNKSLLKFNVLPVPRNQLLGALAAMKGDIVEPNASLYAQLGGNAAISAVIDQFITNVAGDARINAFFADAAGDPARLMKLRNNLINQVGAATGGTEKYTGLDMKAAHKGMGVGEADFNALVDDLNKSLLKFNVLPKPRNQLLSALAAMKGDIVEGNTPLYTRLGMNAGITLVIDDFIGKVAADKRINAFFAAAAADPARLNKLKMNLVNQVGAASGGAEKYTGLSMKAAHKGMNIKDAEFNALVEDLTASLVKYNVQSKAKIELLGALGGMRADIVGQ
jgi:truncated hemoglobin YjbI